MYDNISNLETNFAKTDNVRKMLTLLSSNYFDKVIRDDSLIVYNYKNFHNAYGALLDACIDILNDVVSNGGKEIEELYKKNKKQ